MAALRTIAIARVKNEIDIVEPFIRHHAHYFDHILIEDDGSVDGTLETLIALQGNGLPIILKSKPSVGQANWQVMNALMHQAFTEFAADWVVPLDADEFIEPPEGKALVDVLAARQPNLLAYGWSNFVWESDLDGQSDANPVTRMRLRMPPRQDHRKVLVPSEVFRPGNCTLWMGNHGVSCDGVKLEPEVLDDVSLCHFPIRSVGQFASKVAILTIKHEAAGRRAPETGFHYREPFRQMQLGLDTFAQILPETSRSYSSRSGLGEDQQPTIAPLRYVGGHLSYTKTEVNYFSNLLTMADQIAKELGRLKADHLALKQEMADAPSRLNEANGKLVDAQDKVILLLESLKERDELLRDRDTAMLRYERELAKTAADLATFKAGGAMQLLEEQRAHQRAADLSEQRQSRLTATERELSIMKASTMWRVAEPLRRLGGRSHRTRTVLSTAMRLAYWAATPTRMPARLRVIRHVRRQRGISFLDAVLIAAVSNRRPFDGPGVPLGSTQTTSDDSIAAQYARWVNTQDTLSAEDRRAIRLHISKLMMAPKISVVMPTYNTPERALREAIESVQHQLYENWELCIADDCSSKPHVGSILSEYSEGDSRIKYVRRAQNGHIAAASNTALGLATGDFIALMDHDDLLAEHALYEIAAEINAHPDADILFSDEDKIDEQGRRFDPYFKPGFSIDLLLGQNMVNHLGVYRKSLIDTIGGFRGGFDGSQDYDLLLRAVAQTTPEKIRHIPAILYHWRQESGGGSFSQEYLDRCMAAARKAVDEFLNPPGQSPVAEVSTISKALPYNRVRWSIPDPPPRVSIIIPTRDRVELMRQCMEGLLKRTEYANIEVIIVDNGSVEDVTKAFFQELQSDGRVRILKFDGPFNYSALNNAAARIATGEILLLLNNDIDVIEPLWLSEMVSLMGRPDVGVVGAKLNYGDGRVQHAGVRLGAGTFDGGPGIAGHLGLFAERSDPGYFSLLALPRDVAAVTGACLAVRKEIYEKLGGLDEENLAVAFNDIDLCLRVREAGYRVVWTPFAELYHLESASRGSDLTGEKMKRFHGECRYMLSRWGEQLASDPFYNAAFDSFESDFKLSFSSRRRAISRKLSPKPS